MEQRQSRRKNAVEQYTRLSSCTKPQRIVAVMFAVDVDEVLPQRPRAS